jgi:tetratricopeptide (TPR) repeat protein
MWRSVSESSPGSFRARVQLGIAFADRGDHARAESALRSVLGDIERALSEGKGSELVAARNPAVLMYTALIRLGQVVLRQDRVDEAAGIFAAAAALEPGRPEGYSDLAVVRIMQGREGEAEELLLRALSADASCQSAHSVLAGLLAMRGEHRRAAVHYRAVLARAPDYAVPQAQYAWMLATSPDPGVRNGAVAVKHARIAVDRTGGRSFRAYDALGAALAETGDFAGAAEAAGKALDLLRRRLRDGAAGEGTNMLEEAGQIEGRIILYRTGSPYRQP